MTILPIEYPPRALQACRNRLRRHRLHSQRLDAGFQTPPSARRQVSRRGRARRHPVGEVARSGNLVTTWPGGSDPPPFRNPIARRAEPDGRSGFASCWADLSADRSEIVPRGTGRGSKRVNADQTSGIRKCEGDAHEVVDCRLCQWYMCEQSGRSGSMRRSGKMPIIDLSFVLVGTTFPLDHGYCLFSAICRVVPGLHGDRQGGCGLTEFLID